MAGDIFSGRSRGVEVYPRQGKSPLEHQKYPSPFGGGYFFRSLPGSRSLSPLGEIPAEHQKSFISKGWTFHRARDKIE
nr:MAG TPA: hypothetical protein [Caudoviricetes sp.]